MKVFTTIIAFILFCFPGSAQDDKARSCLLNMLEAIAKVKTASYSLILHERINQNFKDSEFNVKLQVSPFKLYAISIKQNTGAEALLIDGKNNQKALINPNRFPYVNLNLSPHNSLLRKNHHYTFFDVGFSYVERILKGYIKRDQEAFYKALHFYESITYNGKEYYMLEIDYTNYGYVNYTVQKGETLPTIADKLLVNDYKILSINPQISGYDDTRKGQVIKVPNVFARKIVLYLDKSNFLPLVQTVYDENGLFGRYEMRNFKLNPVFDPAEFTSTFPGYHF